LSSQTWIDTIHADVAASFVLITTITGSALPPFFYCCLATGVCFDAAWSDLLANDGGL
jgi:uncharacterized membrane protein YdjX (TVP38/TMEM64 family)